MNADEIVKGLRCRLGKVRGGYPAFAKAHAIDYSWLSKFANGKISNPTVQSVETLDRALAAWENETIVAGTTNEAA